MTNEDAAISIRRPASSNSKEIRRIHSFCMLLLFLASRGSVWFLEPPFYAWLTQRRNEFFRIDLCEADICARKYFISAIDFYSRCSLLEKSPREKDEGFGRMILPHSFRWPDLGHRCGIFKSFARHLEVGWLRLIENRIESNQLLFDEQYVPKRDMSLFSSVVVV